MFSTPCAQGYCEHQGMQGERANVIMEDPFLSYLSLSPCCSLNPCPSLEKQQGTYVFCVAENALCEPVCPDRRSKMCLFLVLSVVCLFSFLEHRIKTGKQTRRS